MPNSLLLRMEPSYLSHIPLVQSVAISCRNIGFSFSAYDLPCQPCLWAATRGGCAGVLGLRRRRSRRRARAASPPPLAPPGGNKGKLLA